MLITLTGKPGTGKTLTMTYFAYKNFKEDNPPLKVWFREKILRKKWIYILRQYSDYPIVFKRPKKNKKYYYYDENGEIVESDRICSLKCRIFDLVLDNKFINGAKFYFDEIQAKYDSMEYKDFPDSIAHYCQAHRHFDNDIFVSSQSQSRIIKRILVLTEEYWNIQSFKKILGFGVCQIRQTWEMSASLENGAVNDNLIDVCYFRKLFRLKKIGSMYDSKYLRYLQQGSKPYKSTMYDSLQLDKTDLLNSFFPTQQEKEYLKNRRY